MTSISRIRVQITGAQGLPGVSTFYALDGPSGAASVQAFYSAIINRFARNVSYKVEENGDIINDTDGELTGSWTTTTLAGGTSAATDSYAAGVGACVTWLTTVILSGHRVKGRTFIVPMGGGQYQNDGTLDNSVLTSLQGSAESLATDVAGNLVVWHRPRLAKPADGSRPAVTARVGAHAPIEHAVVHDKIAVLTSRRD